MLVFTPHQIQELLEVIDKHHAIFVTTNIGTDFLSQYEKQLLKDSGIDVSKWSGRKGKVEEAFSFGILTSAISDERVKEMNYKDFKKFVYSKNFIPLSQSEKAAIEHIKYQTYSDIKNLANKVKSGLSTIIVDNDKTLQSKFSNIVRDEAVRAVELRKSVADIVSEVGHKTGQWERDLGRIAEYTLHGAYEEGRAAQLEKEGGREVLVYKDVYPGACKHCIKHYLTAGLGSKPVFFKLSDLKANGLNVGKKVDDWLPTLGSLHPYCFASGRTPILTDKGYRWINKLQVGDLVLTHKGRFRKITKLIFREERKSVVEKVYTITVDVRGNRVTLSKITGNHPVLVGSKWTPAKSIVIGDKMNITTLPCKNERCSNTVPIISMGENRQGTQYSIYSSGYCSGSCGKSHTARIQWKDKDFRELVTRKNRESNYKRFKSMSPDQLSKLTQPAREACNKKYPNNTSPFYSEESKSKANRSNGKKCSFIELKLRYLLDKLDIEYVTDFYVRREEKKSNGISKLYFPDIYIPSLNMVIEADGINWHDTLYDNKRDEDIKKLIGADTFRFTEHDINNSGEEVFKRLERLVNNHSGSYSLEECKVLEIKGFVYSKSSESVKLYNFSVEEDESYVVNGIVVHNCRCTVNEVQEGYEWSDKEGEFKRQRYQPKSEKVKNRKKISIKIGEEEYLV